MSKYARYHIRNALMTELGERVYGALWHENWLRDKESL